MANVLSTKRLMIDKANTRIVIYVSVAAFILVFSLVATKTLLSQAKYQNRVISAKRTTVDQLHSDINATKQLKKSYQAFVSTTQNVIGGDPNGTSFGDGDNAKIVLDALPSGYDFPGLTTSIEALAGAQNVSISSIGGTDDEANQSTNQLSATPTAVPMPFQLSTISDYAGTQRVLTAFQQSIRPIQVMTLDIAGSENNLTMNITAQSYYQPAKSLNITKTVIQ